jgi:single-strand DNA-binding protein
MAKDLNKVMIIGRLGKDPEMRFTPSGSPVTNFTVAAGRQWKDPNGENREETEWFSVVVWNKLAEICNQYLSKGSRVYIEGRLQTRSWDDQQTGEKKYRTEVVASDMIILDSRAEGASQQRNSGRDRDSGSQEYGRGGSYGGPDVGDDDIPF